jgi:hypothetical protein
LKTTICPELREEELAGYKASGRVEKVGKIEEALNIA